VVGLRSLLQQTVGVRLPVGLDAGFAERFQEQVTILIPQENGFPTIPAIHHMVNRTLILHS